MSDLIKVVGNLKVHRIRNGYEELIYKNHNSINSVLLANLATTMISRSVNYGVDAMAWGSYRGAYGSFWDSDYAGTTGSGTKGGLVQGVIAGMATYTGTFTFSTNKSINMFRMGRGYTAAGAGVTELFTSVYTYDSSLYNGGQSLSYVNGDLMILNWSIQVG